MFVVLVCSVRMKGLMGLGSLCSWLLMVTMLRAVMELYHLFCVLFRLSVYRWQVAERTWLKKKRKKKRIIEFYHYHQQHHHDTLNARCGLTDGVVCCSSR